MNDIIKAVQAEYLKKDVPSFEIGDTVDVHVKIVEGDKERVQVFSGTVIAKKNAGVAETFTVRRIVAGEGVERVFPVHSPSVGGHPGQAQRARPPRQALLPARPHRQGRAPQGAPHRQEREVARCPASSPGSSAS